MSPHPGQSNTWSNFKWHFKGLKKVKACFDLRKSCLCHLLVNRWGGKGTFGAGGVLPVVASWGRSFASREPWLLAVPSSDTQANAFFIYYITAERD